MKPTTARLILLALGAVCFTLATLLQPLAARWGGRAQSDNLIKVFLGEGRRLFANHFYTQADVVLHSGYYPSIFDQARRNMKTSAMAGGSTERPEAPAEAEGHVHDETCQHGHDAEHEREMAFLQEPRDWIERFGRRFLITEHTHLGASKELEILPWLKLSAELDPQRVETYTVAAYWLKRRGKVAEAEQFLREGLRNNPDSYEILYELGRLHFEDKHDFDRARNIWELALARWSATEGRKEKPDLVMFERIVVHLATAESELGHYERAIGLLELAKKASPHPQDLQRQIEELRLKLNATPKAN